MSVLLAQARPVMINHHTSKKLAWCTDTYHANLSNWNSTKLSCYVQTKLQSFSNWENQNRKLESVCPRYKITENHIWYLRTVVLCKVAARWANSAASKLSWIGTNLLQFTAVPVGFLKWVAWEREERERGEMRGKWGDRKEGREKEREKESRKEKREEGKKVDKEWFHPGSNRGPWVCKTHVITTTPWNHLPASAFSKPILM